MDFWSVKWRTIVLLALLGVGVWKSHEYLTTTEDHLVAIDTKTGKILWNQQLLKQSHGREDPYHYPPIPLSNTSLLVTDFQKVNEKVACSWREFNQQSGDLMWYKSAKDLGLEGCPMSGILGVAQDGLFYTFWEGTLWKDPKSGQKSPQQAIVAIDFNDHKVRWVSPIQSQKMPMSSQFQLSNQAEGALILRSSQIFAAMNLRYPANDYSSKAKEKIELRALKLESGDPIWQKRLDGAIGYGSITAFMQSLRMIDYQSSVIFSWGEGLNDTSLRSYDMRTGNLEASLEKIDVSDIKREGDRIYIRSFFGQDVRKFKPILGKHILNNSSQKISFKNPLCSTVGDFIFYPSKNNLFGFCEVDKVAYNDPESHQVMALDDRTGQQNWQLYSLRNHYHLKSYMVIDDASERLFMPTVFRDAKSQKLIPQIQSITPENGQNLWRLPIDSFGKFIISGDRLFVMARLPRWQTLPITRPKPLAP